MSTGTCQGITENTITADIHHIVYDSDLRKITQRAVFQRLEDKYGISLEEFKSHIYERAVEEARLRIQSSPELQKLQQINNPKYYYHGDINTKQLFNTIYNTTSNTVNYSLSSNTPNYSSPFDLQPTSSSISTPISIKSSPINYIDVKKHYIGNGAQNRFKKRYSNNNSTSSESGNDGHDDDDEDDDDERDEEEEEDEDSDPPAKKRKLNHHPSVTGTQSKRESDKDTIYEFSDELKELINFHRGTWRFVWKWITDYAQKYDLKISNRKIRCDLKLKKVFKREESSLSGISRLIWKHLNGSIEKDENGNFKKLIYRKRGKKKEKKASIKNKDNNNFYNPYPLYSPLNIYKSKNQHTIPPPQISQISQISQKEEEIITPVRKKRRYRKRKRDENGQIIKIKKRSGLTRLCFMSDSLKYIVGNDGPLPRNKITKGFWDYTEKHKLKKKGRIIICDEALKKIWEHKDEIHMYDVQKGLKSHINTMSKEEEKKYKEENPELFPQEEEEEYDRNLKKNLVKNKNSKKQKNDEEQPVNILMNLPKIDLHELQKSFTPNNNDKHD